MVERVLGAGGRRMEEEHVALLGAGSIGTAILRLLLRTLPHRGAERGAGLHYRELRELRLEAARPYVEDYLLDEDLVGMFRARFGTG